MQGQAVSFTLKDGSSTKIDNVLIEPKNQVDVSFTDTDTDPIAYRLHIPKSFVCSTSYTSLSHARCEIFGDTYRVLGNPKPYMEDNTPTEWIMPVDVAWLGYEQSFMLQKAYFSQNEKGDSMVEWVDLVEIPCRVLELSQEKTTDRAKVESEKTLVLTCDYHVAMEGLTSTNSRVVYNGKNYTTNDFRNATQSNDVIRLEVVRVE